MPPFKWRGDGPIGFAPDGSGMALGGKSALVRGRSPLEGEKSVLVRRESLFLYIERAFSVVPTEAPKTKGQPHMIRPY